MMTVEKCLTILEEIRQRQGTDRPLVRIKTEAAVMQGRISSDPTKPIAPRNTQSPYALLVLEHPGLARGPVALVQIAAIPDDGIAELECR